MTHKYAVVTFYYIIQEINYYIKLLSNNREYLGTKRVSRIQVIFIFYTLGHSRVHLRVSTDIERRVTWRRVMQPIGTYGLRDRRRNALSNRSSLFIDEEGNTGDAARR